LFFALILSCNNNTTIKEGAKEPDSEQHQHGVLADSVHLDQGKKWKSDAVTNENISSLQQIVGQLKQIKNPGLQAYNEAGAQMQKQLDKLISDCRMKGADHEALHTWLTPLFMNIPSLAKSKDTTEASQLIETIYSHVNSYTN
jgi:hypothetical protein